jgi:hypothetical protein
MKKFNHCGGFFKILRKFNRWLNTLRLGEYPFEETKMKSLEKYHNPLVAEGELIKKNHGSQNVFAHSD